MTAATMPVGRRLVQALLDADPEQHVLAVAAEQDPSGMPRCDRLRYEQCDLTRERDVRRLLFGGAKQLGVDVVVHTPLHRSASDEGAKVHALNVQSTRELLYQSERHPTIRRFVFRSHGDVYRIEPSRPTLIGEEHPLDFSSDAPQRVRDRVEADLTVCSRMGMTRMSIAVLRCAEILARDVGSQLYDYLASPLCFRPLGFDPMVNLLSPDDAVNALTLAVRSTAEGAFNIPGVDTLPLSLVVEKWGRLGIAVPGPLLAPLYRLRASALGMEFRYDMNYRRLHFSAILDGSRARLLLGYEPGTPVAWPEGVHSQGRLRAPAAGAASRPW